jgi:glycosyltransferase involved in cell wall biosynthesis
MYTSPVGYPPIERAATILLDHGAEVRILGTYGHNTDALGGLTDERVDLRLIRGVGSGVIQKLRYLFFNIWSLFHVILWRPDWYYASDPMSTPAALAAAALGTRVVYHEHDMPAGHGGSLFMRTVAAARKRLLQRASVVVVPNVQRAAILGAQPGTAETLVVWNCPSRSEVIAHHPTGEPGVLRAIYHGTVVPARLPLGLIDALARCRHRVELTVIGYETIGAPGYARELLERAERLGIGDRVSFVGILPRSKMLAWTSRSDIGLALMPMAGGDINERMMAGASNKAFEYLAAGIPLLVADLPEWRALYVDRGVALTGDTTDATSLASALDWAFEHRGALSEMGELGQRIVEEEWNYEVQFAPVVQRLFEQGHEPVSVSKAANSDTRDAVSRDA